MENRPRAFGDEGRKVQWGREDGQVERGGGEGRCGGEVEKREQWGRGRRGDEWGG